MKYRTVELIFIWIIYLALLGKTHINTTSLIYQRNTYRYYIEYIPTYTTSQIDIYIYIYIYIREANTDTRTYILYHIHIEEVHTDITTLTEAT